MVTTGSLNPFSALSTLWHEPSQVSTIVPRSEVSLLVTCPDSDDWRTDPGSPSISQMLQANATRSMIVVSIGSILGNAVLLFLIDRFRRQRILVTTFLILAVLFAITGGPLLSATNEGRSHKVTTAFLGMMHFFFTVVPKTIILVFAVELFPTAYRGTMVGVISFSILPSRLLATTRLTYPPVLRSTEFPPL
jgi:hypothetical protein